MNSKERFELLKKWKKEVCYISAWCCKIIKDSEGEFRLVEFDDSNYVLVYGIFQDELIIDAMTNIENYGLDVDKEGYYNIECLMGYSSPQIGEYGRVEIREYLMIDEIEFEYIGSIEQVENVEQ